MKEQGSERSFHEMAAAATERARRLSTDAERLRTTKVHLSKLLSVFTPHDRHEPEPSALVGQLISAAEAYRKAHAAFDGTLRRTRDDLEDLFTHARSIGASPIPGLPPTADESSSALAHKHDEAVQLVTKTVEERAKLRAHLLESRNRAAADTSDLGPDAPTATSALAAIEEDVAAWKLETAQEKLAKWTNEVGALRQARNEAKARLEQAKREAEPAWVAARALAVEFPVLDATSDGTTPEIEKSAQSVQEWTRQVWSLVADAKRRAKEEQERRAKEEQERRAREEQERRARETPVIVAPRPATPTQSDRVRPASSTQRPPKPAGAIRSEGRPQLVADDHVRALLVPGSVPDAYSALGEPEKVEPVAYLERLGLLRSVVKAETLAELVSMFSASSAVERRAIASYLWTVEARSFDDLPEELVKPTIELARSLCASDQVPAAWVLVSRVASRDETSEILDALYMSYSCKGAAGRARLLQLSSGWEPSSEPLPHQPRAWIFGLALVEAAVDHPLDAEAARRARTFAAHLPKQPPGLQALLLERLEDGWRSEDLEPTETVASVVKQLRDTIAQRTRLTDLWKNLFMREVEREFHDEVLSCLDEIERCTTPAELRRVEIAEAKEKRLRAALRAKAKGKQDPAHLGGRLQDFVEKLEEFTKALEKIRALRMRQLVQPQSQREKVHSLLPTLHGVEESVATALLQQRSESTHAQAASGTPPRDWMGWDEDWFTGGGLLATPEIQRAHAMRDTGAIFKQVLESIIVSSSEGAAAARVRGYFAALRPDPKTRDLVQSAGDEFTRRLYEYSLEQKKMDLTMLREWAEGVAARAQRAGIEDTALKNVIAGIEKRAATPELVDVDAHTQELGEIEARISQRIDETKSDAEHLLKEIKPPERRVPRLDEILKLAREALEREQYAFAVESLRQANDLINNSDLRQVRERVDGFLAKHGPVEPPPPGARGADDARKEESIGQDLRRLEQDLAVAESAYRNVAGVEVDLQAAKAALSTRDFATVERSLAAARKHLEVAPFLDEPPVLADPVLHPIPEQSAPAATLTADAKLYPTLTLEPATFDKAAALLVRAASSITPSTPSYRAIQAEWARLHALRLAYAGEFAMARRHCADFFFLARRWGRLWAKLSSIHPPEDPMLAVQLLFAINIVERAERKDDPASWLIQQARQSSNIEAVRRALACNSPKKDDLGRLVNLAWYLPAHESEDAVMDSLFRLSRWEGEPGWIFEGLVAELTGVNGKKKLSAMATSFMVKQPEWTLSLLDALVHSGRAESDVPVGEHQLWQNLRRHLGAFAITSTAGRQSLGEKLLSLTLRVYPSASTQLRPVVEGVREALIPVTGSTQPPKLLVSLEETIGTLHDGKVNFVLAIENRGQEVIHDIRLHTSSRSQIRLGTPDDPLLLKEILSPDETYVTRLEGGVQEPEEAGALSLGLKVTFRAHDDQSFDRTLETNLDTRRRADIPILAKQIMLGLFNESGAEVFKEGTNFFGRARELEDLHIRLLEKPQHDSIFLEGMRRIGKTSLAKVFLERARDDGDATAFVDFKEYADKGEGEAAPVPTWRTFAFLATRILQSDDGDATFAQRLGFTDELQWKKHVYAMFNEADAPAETLQDLLRAVGKRLNERRMVVVVDELDYFVNPWEGGGQGQQNVYDFFNVMRALLAAKEGTLGKFRWLLSGSDRCAEMFTDYRIPLHGSIAKMKLEGVDRKECDQILVGSFEKIETPRIQITEQAKQEVYEQTGGVPFFVQIIGNRLCNVLLEEQTDLVSRWHVRQAVARSMPKNEAGEAPASFDRLLEPTKQRADGRLLDYILALIATRTSDVEPGVKVDEVCGASEKLLGSRLSRQEIMTHARTLETYQVISIDQQEDHLIYEIKVPLVRRLVQAKYDYHLSVVKEKALQHLNASAPR